MQSNMQKPCRTCGGSVVGNSGSLQSIITDYLLTLDPETCVPEELYQTRLGHCSSCPGMHDLTCRYCGCFVQVRAKRADRHCPLPGQPKW